MRLGWRTRDPGARRHPATLSAHGGLDEEPGVEQGNDDGGGPGEALEPAAVDEPAHELAIAGEEDEGDDGEAELEGEDHLAEDEELLGSLFSGDGDNEDGGDDGEAAGDEAAEPLGDADVDEALHDNLAGEGAGNGGVLAGGKQSDGEERAGAGGSDERAEELVGVLDGGDLKVAGAMEDGGGNDEDGGIDEEGDAERES